MHIKTIKIRIKDSSAAAELSRMAKAVDFVWNYCNETSYHALKTYSKWMSGFDLNNLTAGSAKDLGLHSSTIQSVCEEHGLRRRKAKKAKLRWRGKKSLGWIPFKSSAIKIENGILRFRKKCYKVFQPERMPVLASEGEFSQDARGRWYICLSVKCEEILSSAKGEVGIDLGIKNIAVLSNGLKIENRRYFKRMEGRLANAQKAKKKRLVKTFHAKIKNQRLDYLHKSSTQISNHNWLVIIGKLDVQSLKKTRLGKSFSDAGTTIFKTMLHYKASARSHRFVEVDETNTTRTCSSCEKIPASAPTGVKGLSIREWVCSLCHRSHDRDINAAMNILRLGRQALAAKGR